MNNDWLLWLYESDHLKALPFFTDVALICVCLWVFSQLFEGYDTMRGLNSLEMLYWN